MTSAALMLGRLITTAVSLALIVSGVKLADTCPPMSGGNFAGSLLVLFGGLLFVRMAQVAHASADHAGLSVDVSLTDSEVKE